MQTTDSKYLCFRLGGESYGVEILKVREIIALMEITALPEATGHVKGVINLRGKIVPVLDLRSKFGLAAQESRRENCIITVSSGSGEASLVGILVDSVSEVLNLEASVVEPLPALGHSPHQDYVLGLAKAPGQVIILLNLDKVIEATDVLVRP